MAQLLSMAALLSVAVGQQQVGVSLVLLGQTIPNNSLVNHEDLLYLTNNNQPTNVNGLQTLMCVTDLEDCCESPRSVRGNWYYPDGRTVVYNTGGATFQRNRGANEVINNQQFYGSVRLWHRFTGQERGLFCCELPDASAVTQTLCVNILFFDRITGSATDSVAISPSGSTTAGGIYSLLCSANLAFTRNPSLPDPIIPSPTFEWFFGPNGDFPLPSNLISDETASSNSSTSITYRSTLQFFSLSQSHAGNYTCRLGVASLVNSHEIIVTDPPISVMITANLNIPLMVGQTGNTLTCGVTGAEGLNPTIDYRWTRNGEMVQDGSSNTLTLPPLTLSDAGEYSCNATVGSTLLTNDIEASTGTWPQRVEIQVPAPQSVTVTSSPGTIFLCVSTVIVTCIVELGPAVRATEVSLLMVDAQLSRDGTPLTLTGLTVTGTTFNFEATIRAFSENDVGNYSCMVTITPQPSSFFLTGMRQLESSPFEITIGAPAPARSPGGNTGCTVDELAIAVVVTISIECLLAAPVIAAMLVLYWKKKQRKIPTQATAIQGKEVMEEVYEDPDKIATTTAPGTFVLADCPAYVSTAYPDKLQPCTVTEAQNSDYEL